MQIDSERMEVSKRQWEKESLKDTVRKKSLKETVSEMKVERQ
jgi:hypothetical protein